MMKKFLCVFILSVRDKCLITHWNLVSHRLYIHTVDLNDVEQCIINDFRGRAPSSVFSSSTTRINAILAI